MIKTKTDWSIEKSKQYDYGWAVFYRNRHVATFFSERRAKEYAEFRLERAAKRRHIRNLNKRLYQSNPLKITDPGWTPPMEIGDCLPPSDT